MQPFQIIVLVGIVNAVLVEGVGLTPLLATLATSVAVVGLTKWITNNRRITVFDSEFVNTVRDGSFIGIPIPALIMIGTFVVLGFAMLFEGGAWYFAFKEFGRVKGTRGYIEAVQKGKDPTFFVVLFEDSAAMLGLLVALIGVWLGEVTGNPVFDGIASIIIGLILGATAGWLAYETKSLLIGERANPEVADKIKHRKVIIDSRIV